MSASIGVERDLADLRRNTAIWLVAEIWIVAGYALQDPPKDAYDAAERAAFTLAMAVIIPLISTGFVLAWWPLLRGTRSGAGSWPGRRGA